MNLLHERLRDEVQDVAAGGPSWNLSDFLASQARQLYRYETQTTEAVLEAIKRALPGSFIQALRTSPQQDQGAISAIRQIGKMLWEQHGIVQYLVTKRKHE